MSCVAFFTPGYWRGQFWPAKWRFLAFWLGTYGAIWGLVEPMAYFFPDLKPPPNPWLWIFLATGPLHGLARVWPKCTVRSRIEGTDLFAEVHFGDVFNTTGALVVPCNTTFDIEIDIPGGFLVPTSVQGQFVAREFPGNVEELDHLVSRHLDALGRKGARKVETLTTGAKPGKLRRYKPGTIVPIIGPVSGRQYYLLAMSHVNSTGRAYTSIEVLRESLVGLWCEIPRTAPRADLVIPLLATNMGRLGNRRREIYQEILLTFLEAVRTGDSAFANKLTIVVYHKDAERLSLSVVELGQMLVYACR